MKLTMIALFVSVASASAIAHDAVGHLEVTSVESSVIESVGAADFTVRLVPGDPLIAIDRPVSAQLYVSGRDATAGEDFEDVLTTLEFLPGETEKTVSIQVFDDLVGEQLENFMVAVRNGDGVVAGSGAIVEIIDNDTVAGPADVVRAIKIKDID